MEQNVIRFDHLEEDMLALSAAEEANLPTAEEAGTFVSHVGSIRFPSDPLYFYTPSDVMVESYSPIVS